VIAKFLRIWGNGDFFGNFIFITRLKEEKENNDQ